MVVLLLRSHCADAVCLDAQGVSGYHEPLKREMTDSSAVVVATVVGAKPVSEDPSDPDGVTATIFHIKVSEEIRGTIPPEVDLRDNNDSGRFGFELGKTYVLFLRPVQADGTERIGTQMYWVSPCGSSAEQARADKLLHQLRSRKTR